MVDDILYNDIIHFMEKTKKEMHCFCLGTEMLLLALISIPDSMTNLILKELRITKENIIDKINHSYFLRKENHYTSCLEEVIHQAQKLESEKEYVYDEAYLYSLLSSDDNAAINILRGFEIEGRIILDELNNALDYLQQESNILINITKMAKEGKNNPFIGRKDYLERMDRILSKKQKNNCMLIGLAGVGKSGLVEGLANLYLTEKPTITIYRLDLGSVLAGTRYRGDLEERLMDVLDDIKNQNCILFIDEIHNILSTGYAENSMDIANILKPYLARSNIKCIGATTIEEYYKYIDKDKALARRFQNIYVTEPKQEECYTILQGIKKDYENFHNVKYTDEVIYYIIKASSYISNRYFPDKAIDLLDECGLYTRRKHKEIVDALDIQELILENKGINKNLSLEKLNKVSNNIKNDLYNYLTFNIEKYILWLNCNNDEEIKQYQKEIMDILSLNEEHVLEIDFHDYTDQHQLSTLLGTSPGYVGYDEGGILSNHILKHDISIVIFKNMSKENRLLFKMIDKIKNTGKIKDYKGNDLIFKNTCLLFLEEKKEKIGFNF